jgi:hypothetical protein
VRPTAPALTVVLVLLLTACGGQERPTVEPGDEADGAFDGTVEGTDEAGDADDDADGDAAGDTMSLDHATDAAVADLAAEEGVDEAAIEVVSADRVTWSDGSLGCPEPGGMYTQALVPGYRIVLAVDGTEVHYHGADGSAPSRCDDPIPPADEGF